jgi:hypothetical protein
MFGDSAPQNELVVSGNVHIEDILLIFQFSIFFLKVWNLLKFFSLVLGSRFNIVSKKSYACWLNFVEISFTTFVNSWKLVEKPGTKFQRILVFILSDQQM